VPAALAVFLALYAPWMAYQKSFAPPGDRLVKWHLAGSMAIDGRGALRTVVDAYSSRTLGELLAIKASSLKTVFGSFPTGWDQWRSDEFLFTSRALGPLVLGFLPLLLPALVRRTSPAPPDRTAVAAAALFAAASLVLWCLVKWDNTCVHEGSFLTMILLFVLAAAGLVTAPAAVALPLIALDGALFALKWTSLPDSQAAPLPDWTAFSALCLLAAAFLAWRSRRMGDQA
jgi:hypothetical protein